MSNIVQFLDCKSLDEFANSVNRKQQTRTAYLCLDSKYARFLNNNTKLQWDLMETLTEGPNSVNVKNNIRNITSVRMLSFTLPQFNSVAKRASILIDELSTQAFIMPNRKFHFIGYLVNLSTGSGNVQITPLNSGIYTQADVYDFTLMNKYELLIDHRVNDGYYYFNKPVVLIDSITISVADPFSLITLPQFQYVEIPVSFASGVMTLTFPNTPQLPGFPPYDPNGVIDPTIIFTTSMFISSFTTDQPVADALWISTINTYEFTNLTVISGNTLTVQTGQACRAGFVDPFVEAVLVRLPTYGLPPPVGNPSPITVNFNSNRILMNIEIEYLI